MADVKQLAKLKHAADMVREVLRDEGGDTVLYVALFSAAHEIDTARMLLQSRKRS